MEVLHAEFHISASTPRPLTDPQPTVSPRRSEAHSARPATPKPSTEKTESRRPLPRLLPVHTLTYGGPVHQVSALYASLGYSATTAAKSSPGEEGLSSRLDTSTPALDWATRQVSTALVRLHYPAPWESSHGHQTGTRCVRVDQRQVQRTRPPHRHPARKAAASAQTRSMTTPPATFTLGL